MLLQFRAVERMRTMTRCPTMAVCAWERARYVDRNARVLDPVADIETEARIRPWTTEEKAIFMDRFLQFPKVGVVVPASERVLFVCTVSPPPFSQDFRKIATFLPDRTTADCVQFYYKFQKCDEFALVRRKQQLKKRRLHSDMKRSYNFMQGMGGMARQNVAPPPERGRGRAPGPLQEPPPGGRARGRPRGRTTRRQAELLEESEVVV